MNDNEETRLIVTKHGREYIVPARDGLTWAQRYPNSTPLKGFEDHKFWPTLDGWVIARPIDTD